jgi:hypothetical protein
VLPDVVPPVVVHDTAKKLFWYWQSSPYPGSLDVMPEQCEIGPYDASPGPSPPASSHQNTAAGAEPSFASADNCAQLGAAYATEPPPDVVKQLPTAADGVLLELLKPLI